MYVYRGKRNKLLVRISHAIYTCNLNRNFGILIVLILCYITVMKIVSKFLSIAIPCYIQFNSNATDL